MFNFNYISAFSILNCLIYFDNEYDCDMVMPFHLMQRSSSNIYNT